MAAIIGDYLYTIGSVVPIHIRMESTPAETLKRVEGHRIIARSAGDVISQHYTGGFAPRYDLIRHVANARSRLSERVQIYCKT